MQDLLEKFNPFSATKEHQTVPELAFDGVVFPDAEKYNYITYTESPDNPNSCIVVNRGHQQDCRMIKEHLNDLMREHLKEFLLKNLEEVIDELYSIRENQRESKLTQLSFEFPTEEQKAKGNFGAI